MTAGTLRAPASLADRFGAIWEELAPIGRRAGGGYDRFAWTPEDRALREWFRRAAAARSMEVDEDRNANLWAYWHGPTAQGAARRVVATGSHLDSVPAGGAFDGALGVVGGFLAIDLLRAERSLPPGRSLAVAVFVEEEGARFGVACLGSRLSTGVIDPDTARALTDTSGVSLAEAMETAGADPSRLGADEDRLAALDCYVELHIEQGRRLVDLGAAVGIASGIWPHGRWRLRFDGEPNHAGTARLEDRHDPMLPFAEAVVGARGAAAAHGGLATVGRAEVRPNATNGVAASVEAWLDARAPDEATLAAMVADVWDRAAAAAGDHGVRIDMREESATPAVVFDGGLRRKMRSALRASDGSGDLPEIPTGAGHDAGILAACVPTGMVFVRNRTGVSHSPSEEASLDDCVAGIDALARTLGTLAWG
ncbi:MAG: allantoate amidohydrolase [Acidimicrobiales bacterium]